MTDLLNKTKGPDRRNWEIGEKLGHVADYVRLSGGDFDLIEGHLQQYINYTRDLNAQHAVDPRGLLEQQRYSSDIHARVYGLHQVGVATDGLGTFLSVLSTSAFKWFLSACCAIYSSYVASARCFKIICYYLARTIRETTA